MTKAEKEKKRYNDRKKDGLCVRCGKVPSRSGRTMCESCTEKQKEKYKKDRQFFASLGLCPKCGKNKLFGDEKNCPECNAQSGIYRKDSYVKEYYIRRRKEKEEKGLCLSCGTKERAGGHIYCEECLERRNARSREIRRRKKKPGIKRSERPSYGMCYFCGDEVVDELRVCERCRKRLEALSRSRNAIKARERMKEDEKGLFRSLDLRKSAVN